MGQGVSDRASFVADRGGVLVPLPPPACPRVTRVLDASEAQAGGARHGTRAQHKHQKLCARHGLGDTGNATQHVARRAN